MPTKTPDSPPSAAVKLPKDKLLPKMTMWFFNKPLLTALLWLALVVFGALSYTTLLRREGFPSVNIPVTIVSGTYVSSDPAKVDAEATKPIVGIALKQPNVSSVQSQSASNFFTVNIQFKEGTDAKEASKVLEKAVNESGQLPASAQVQYNVPYFGATGGDIEQVDMAVSFFDSADQTPTADLVAKANYAAKWLNDQHIPEVKTVFVKDPFKQVTDPATGQAVTVQRSFDRFGNREGYKTGFYNSVLLGITESEGADVIKLDDNVREALGRLQSQPEMSGFRTEVSASFATSIKDNISELQRVLLEGLIAVLIVGSIVIAIRASFITVISMVTVVLISLGFLYAIGYSLNVITLFALILGLALVVDDTIIMVEAIDAARSRAKDRRDAVLQATRKISRAMVAATLVACLSFAPLLFVGGVLGSFIRAIPITIIASLIISLFVALIFIPLMSRFLLLGKKQMGKAGVKEVAAGFEKSVAAVLAKPMIWARHSRAKLFTVGTIALVFGFVFIAAGLFISKDVVFNIFPPTKDTNGLAVQMLFPPNTTLEQAQAIAAKAEPMASEVVGPYFEIASYYNTGTAQGALMQVQITPYSKRTVTSPEIVKQLQDRYDSEFKDAKVVVAQLDVGPPTSSFIVQLTAENREAAYKAANDLAAFMKTAELKRINGTTAHMTNVTVSSPDSYMRTGSRPIITVSSGFDADDTTTLVTLAKDAVSKEFPDSRLQGYGLNAGDLTYDLGQETENQESFKTLAIAFPALLVVIFILLAIQFRSLLQPLLIFMAIPFSIFGVMLGLDITDNAISFFTMLGFFALIGLSIKNTILLTDFANQSRKQGLSAVDSAVAALEERFRPLFATSMTAVVSLIPLALSSPFWEGLAVVLIFGLLSSTFLVLTVFPYYYLGAEYLRVIIGPKKFFLWFIPTVIIAIGVGILVNPGLGALMVPLSLLLVIFHSFFERRAPKKATP